MFLDTNTLLVAVACTSLFSAVLLIGIYRINSAEPAILHWGLGNALFGIGAVLSAMQSRLDPAFSLVLPNLLQAAGSMLLVAGLLRFLRLGVRPGLLAAAVALQFAIHVYFVYAEPVLWPRLVNTSLFMALLALWPLILLQRLNTAEHSYSVAIPFLRLGFALQCIAYVLWCVYALRVQPPGPFVNTSAPSASTAMLQILCTSFIVNISFVLLVMERIHLLLRHRAAIDELTAVFNRRAFNQIAEAELARADRSHIWPALLVLDLDHFKSVNDRFGHTAGDEVLRRFGALIKSCTRAGDIVARMGGEEFAALLPATDLARATSVAERIRTALEAEVFVVNGQRFQVTTSIGLTIILPQDTLHSAFVRADAALYAAKDLGRNRVMTHTAPLPANEPTVPPTPQYRAPAPSAPDPTAPAPDALRGGGLPTPGAPAPGSDADPASRNSGLPPLHLPPPSSAFML